MQLFDLLHEKGSSPHTSKLIALSHKSRGIWKRYTYGEYLDFAQKLGWALFTKGVEKGDNIGSMISGNRPEWNFLDMALLQIGAVHVSLFPTFDSKDLVRMLNESELKYLFVGNKTIARAIKALFPQLGFLHEIICFENTDGEFLQWENWVGEVKLDNVKTEKLNELSKQVGPDDLSAILYTSGTGGNPNGVVWCNQQLLNMVNFFTPEIFEINVGDNVLSFLPLNHAYERYHSYIYLNLGASVHYADSGAGVVENLNVIRPVVFNGVPLLMEKLFDNIRSRITTLEGDEQESASKAFQHALTYDHGTKDAYATDPATKLFEQKYYGAWRELLGGKLRHIGVSGAKLPTTISKLFWGIGIPIFEVYGITETSFVTFTHPKFGAKFGSVGRPIPFRQVRISEDGEILCYGPCMMRGYYKNEALDKIVFDDEGWYHTKDLGEIDDEGFLILKGRKNNFFKLASGKFINPEDIEKMLLQSPHFKNAMVTINASNELVALICVDEELAPAEVSLEINNLYNSLVMETERINKWFVIPNTWAPETGELTPLMKIKRNVIRNRYLAQIE